MAVRPMLLAAALAAALSGCGSQQAESGRIVKQALAGFFPGGGGAETAPSPAQQATVAAAPAGLTRAQVDASGVAMIRARLASETARSVLTGASENDGYVSYVSRFGQMLTLRGSLVTASRGLGYDLLSLSPGADDPLVRPRPVGAWPARVTRTYRFPGRGPGGRALSVQCTYVPGQTRRIEIVEVVHTGIQVEERCAGGGVAFSNYHLADARSGFVWRSLQWLGPEQGFIDLEVLEPFTGD
ncbi:YjbF family lipoprotein [Halovulum marinum]|uniref:YjbF family lipoprotein n=1 Tax=Halovulum marinum TaxID=2662447 RepID=UPI001F1ED363|nr:YjbF family lipoprotein [Halovulum marinum]